MHRNAKAAPIAGLFGETLIVISCVGEDVADVNNSPRIDRTRGHGIPIKRHREVRTHELDIIPTDPSNAGDPDEFAIEDGDNADFRATQLLRPLSNDIENG